MAKGPRVGRRDLKEDKVYVTLASVYDYILKNRQWVGLGALGVILIFALAYFAQARSRGAGAEASWERYKAGYMESPSEKKAALEKVVSEYGGTTAGQVAAFDLANMLYDEGRYSEAIEAFDTFAKKNPRHILAASAIEAIGHCHESLGQWEEAKKTYLDLIRRRPDSNEVARAHYRLGLCHEKTGDNDKAIESYEKVVDLLPETLWARYSTQRLDALKAAMPTPAIAEVEEPDTDSSTEPALAEEASPEEASH